MIADNSPALFLKPHLLHSQQREVVERKPSFPDFTAMA